MKLLRHIIGIVIFGMLGLTTALADSAAQYQIDFPVPSQSQSDWQQTVPKAFAQLLGNLTSNLNIANSPKVKKQLSQAQNFVQSYSYITQPGPNGTATLLLHIQFDPQGVKQLLDQMGVQYQPTTHTQTLVLLATQNGSQRQLVGETGSTALQTSLQNLAKQRNIPLVWPILDLQDLQNINVNQVWSLNAPSATKIAARYGANNILEGWILPAANGSWQSSWLLVANGKTITWTFTGKSSDEIFSLLLNQLASVTTNPNKSAASNSGNQTFILRISNVNGLNDYEAVVKYLRSLAPVTSVDVASVESSDLIVNVTVAGDIDSLNNALSGSNALQAMPSVPGNTTDNQNILEYRWNNQADVPPAVVPVNNSSTPDQAIQP